MEDVCSVHKRHIWCGSIIALTLLLGQVNLYAASQGSVGTTGSRGSISITLEIPKIERISAELRQLPLVDESQLCLHILDVNKASTNFINVAGLEGDILANYNIGLSSYEKSAQSIKSNGLETGACNYQVNVKNKYTENNQPLLLMMIVE